jgi:hypothetical protein
LTAVELMSTPTRGVWLFVMSPTILPFVMALAASPSRELHLGELPRTSFPAA